MFIDHILDDFSTLLHCSQRTAKNLGKVKKILLTQKTSVLLNKKAYSNKKLVIYLKTLVNFTRIDPCRSRV